MEMSIGLGLGILFGTRFRLDRTPILIFALLIMSAAIALTGSRGGMLSLVTVLSTAALFSWYVRRRETRNTSEIMQAGTSSRLGIIAGLSIGVIVVLGLVLFLGGGGSLLRGIGIQSDDPDFTSGRSHFWKIAWEVFQSHPIIGAGFDSFGVATLASIR